MNPLENALLHMPKIELHVHLDGSVKPSTLLYLAQQQNIELPTQNEEELLAYMQVEENCENLNEYLRTFDFVLPIMQTYEALELVAYELVEQCAAQNVKYVEVRFAPQLHMEKGLTVEETYQAVIDGLQRAEKKYGVVARCIGIVLRGHNETQNIQTIDAAAKFLGKGLVAVDLAGAEAIFPPHLYDSVFKRASELNIPITIHAGEAGGAENIAYAVDQLGAVRIGHGVRLQEDMSIFKQIVDRQIPLEFCPISNIQTKAVEGWAAYPIKKYMDQGIIITVNTDNLTVSNTSLTKELVTVAEKFDLTLNELVKLQRNAANAVFLQGDEKQAFVESYINQLEMWQASQEQ